MNVYDDAIIVCNEMYYLFIKNLYDNRKSNVSNPSIDINLKRLEYKCVSKAAVIDIHFHQWGIFSYMANKLTLDIRHSGSALLGCI